MSSEFSVDLLKSYQALNTGSVGKKHCINEGEKHSALIAMETGLWGKTGMQTHPLLCLLGASGGQRGSNGKAICLPQSSQNCRVYLMVER